MNALSVFLSLLTQLASTTLALQAVSELIQKKQLAGEDVTLDDLKSLQLNDDTARDMLVAAIEEAEAQ